MASIYHTTRQLEPHEITPFLQPNQNTTRCRKISPLRKRRVPSRASCSKEIIPENSNSGFQLSSKVGKDFASLFQTPPFKVIVGSSGKTYYINEALLTSTSPYFASLLSFGGEEAASKSVTLSTEVDTEAAFERFIEYLYFENYHYKPKYILGSSAEKLSPEIKVQAEAKMHTQVYVLAERLMIEGLKFCALEKMVAVLADAYNVQENPTTCTNTAKPSHGFGRFCSTPIQAGHFPNYEADMSHEFGFSMPAKTGNRSKISARCLVELVDTVYPNTPDRIQPANEKEEDTPIDGKGKEKGEAKCSETLGTEKADPNKEVETRNTPAKDRMRVLIAKFAASCLSEFKKENVFLELLREGGEFAEDLALELAEGQQIRPDEMSRLNCSA